MNDGFNISVLISFDTLGDFYPVQRCLWRMSIESS